MHAVDDRPLPDVAEVTRIVVTHPLRVWVEALESLLAPYQDIELVAAHHTTQWVQHAVATLTPDVVLMAISPDPEEFLPVLAGFHASHQRLRVVALSETQDPAVVSAAVRAGVRGWVEPDCSGDHLLDVIRGVAAGEAWIPPTLLSGLLDGLLTERASREENQDKLSALSSRELEILQCLTEGLSRRDIANRFVLSPHTVRTHMNNLLRKLDVHSTLAAVSIARRAGLVERSSK